MKWLRSLPAQFITTYLSDLAVGGTGAMVTWLFRDSILAAVGAYHAQTYWDYFEIVILGLAVGLLQAIMLVKWRSATVFLWSTLLFCVLWAVYAAMRLPDNAPLIPVDILWRFSLHVMLLAQFCAILIMLGVAVVMSVRRGQLRVAQEKTPH